MKGVYLWRRAGEHDLAALDIDGGICIFVYLYLYLCLYLYLFMYLWRGAGEHNLDGYQWKYGSTERAGTKVRVGYLKTCKPAWMEPSSIESFGFSRIVIVSSGQFMCRHGEHDVDKGRCHWLV